MIHAFGGAIGGLVAGSCVGAIIVASTPFLRRQDQAVVAAICAAAGALIQGEGFQVAKMTT